VTRENSFPEGNPANIESAQGWQERFSRSDDLLREMIEEALEQDRAGLAPELDPDNL
jgi:hypothetical protein